MFGDDVAEQKALAGRWVMDRMALMFYDAEPRYERLTGWTVRAWSDGVGLEATAYADEWLAILRPGAGADE